MLRRRGKGKRKQSKFRVTENPNLQNSDYSLRNHMGKVKKMSLYGKAQFCHLHVGKGDVVLKVAGKVGLD